MKRSGWIPMLIALSAATATSVSGQHAEARAGSLRGLVDQLFIFGACGEPLCLFFKSEEGLSDRDRHGDHYLPSLAEGNDAILGFTARAIGEAVANVPLAATAGGTILNREADTLRAVVESESLGPVFAERGETLRRNRLFVGWTTSILHLTNFSGVPADNLVLNFAHEDTDNPESLGTTPFEADLLQVRLGLDMTMVVSTALASIGLTDFFDVGVAVPIVRNTLSGRSEAQILPYENDEFLHQFGEGTNEDPILRAAQAVEGSATGVGDIALRAKLRLTDSRSEAVRDATGEKKYVAAIVGDIRLPTGDEDDFLGSGHGSARLMGAFSAWFDPFTPHVNVGYLFNSDAFDNDAVLLNLGFDNEVAAWSTISVDLLTSWQVGANKFPVPQDIVFDAPLRTRIPATSIPNRKRTLIDLAAGAKFRVGNDMVLVANVIVPGRRVGYRPDVVWTLGLQRLLGW